MRLNVFMFGVHLEQERVQLYAEYSDQHHLRRPLPDEDVAAFINVVSTGAHIVEVKGSATQFDSRLVIVVSNRGASNRWTEIWNGTVEWKMEWNGKCTQI